MGRWTKKDYQRLNRATRCDLCGETMTRDDRALNWSASTGDCVSHPGCFEAKQEDSRQSMLKFAALLERAATLEAEAAARQRIQASVRSRAALAGLWVP